eukprot:g29024.t1
MLTPISLARAKSASVLTPRRFRLKTPEQSPQSSHSAMADDKVERLAWSPLSSRTLSPEEEPSSMERERWTDATRAAARRGELRSSKTEEQLAAADRQLTGLLSKAQALIQQSAEQMEEQLVRRSGQLLQAMKARPCGSDLAGRARGLQADQAKSAANDQPHAVNER